MILRSPSLNKQKRVYYVIKNVLLTEKQYAGDYLERRRQGCGNCGYSWDAENFSAELSYILAKPYWNKGIMSEALAAILQFGFDSCRLHRMRLTLLCQITPPHRC